MLFRAQMYLNTGAPWGSYRPARNNKGSWTRCWKNFRFFRWWCKYTKQINAHNLSVLILLAYLFFTDSSCSFLLMFGSFRQLQIQNKKWLENMSLLLLCVMALDRFGDFVSDEVSVIWNVLWLGFLKKNVSYKIIGVRELYLEKE